MLAIIFIRSYYSKHMKEKQIIWIVVFAYICVMIGMYYGVKSYIDSKDSRLFQEINDNLDRIFSQQKTYVDIEYSNTWPEFKEAKIPDNPQKWFKLFGKESLTDSEINKIDSWKEVYGDLASFYTLNCKQSKDGWNLVVLIRDDNGVSISHVFPYAIGFKKHNEFPSSKPEKPSSTHVRDCLMDALKFETTDTKSDYYKYFKEGSFSQKWSEIENAANEYYCVNQDDYQRLFRQGESIISVVGFDGRDYLKYTNSVTDGYVFNFFWKVYSAVSAPVSYSVSECSPGQALRDKKQLWTIWSVVLTILLLGAIIPLSVIIRRREIIINESLYDKLLRLCNPANYINGENYDKAIVDKANDIYKRLKSISGNDIDSLNAIQAEAISELGINLVDKDRVNYLKELADPRNYLKPYNPDKVALANELYAILSKDDISYEELAEVEEKISLLR